MFFFRLLSYLKKKSVQYFLYSFVYILKDICRLIRYKKIFSNVSNVPIYIVVCSNVYCVYRFWVTVCKQIVHKLLWWWNHYEITISSRKNWHFYNFQFIPWACLFERKGIFLSSDWRVITKNFKFLSFLVPASFLISTVLCIWKPVYIRS